MSDGKLRPLPEVYSKEKLEELYEEIPLKVDQVQFLQMYCYTLSNFFGIIPLKKVWDIIQTQNPNLFSKEQFDAFVLVARHSGDRFSVLGDEEVFEDGPQCGEENRTIYSNELLANQKEFQMTRQQQKGKSYYVPEKSLLLHYFDPTFSEPRPQMNALKLCLESFYPKQPKKTDKLFRKLVINARLMTKNVDDAVRIIGSTDLTEDQVRAFMACYREFNNHMRMPCNLGHTPAELEAQKRPVRNNKGRNAPRKVHLAPDVRKALQTGRMNPHNLYQQIMYMESVDPRTRTAMLQEITDIMNAKNNKENGNTGK